MRKIDAKFILFYSFVNILSCADYHIVIRAFIHLFKIKFHPFYDAFN